MKGVEVEGLTRRELGSRFAVLRALKGVVIAEEERLKSELDRMVLEAHDDDGTTGFDLFVGDEKVGRISYVRPSVGVAGGDMFAHWAYDHGMGRKVLTADVSDVPQDVLDELNAVMDENHIGRIYGYEADADARRGLKVAGGHVVDAEGEVVPGTYPRVSMPRAKVETEEVGAALQTLGDSPTVAGLLTGGE